MPTHNNVEVVHQQRHRPAVHRDMMGDQKQERVLFTVKMSGPPYGPMCEIEWKRRRFHRLLPHALPAPCGDIKTVQLRGRLSWIR